MASRQRKFPDKMHDTLPESPFDVAIRGLTGMGFRASESRRAVELVRDHLRDGVPATTPVERVLREALAVLR